MMTSGRAAPPISPSPWDQVHRSSMSFVLRVCSAGGGQPSGRRWRHLSRGLQAWRSVSCSQVPNYLFALSRLASTTDRIRHLQGGQHLWACAALGHLKNEPPEKCSRRTKATAFPYQPALLGWCCRQLGWNGCQERRHVASRCQPTCGPRRAVTMLASPTRSDGTESSVGFCICDTAICTACKWQRGPSTRLGSRRKCCAHRRS